MYGNCHQCCSLMFWPWANKLVLLAAIWCGACCRRGVQVLKWEHWVCKMFPPVLVLLRCYCSGSIPQAAVHRR